jgi:hypothetical protein
MNWTTIAWSVGASAYLSLAIVHLVIWCKQTDQRVHLLFSVTALSTAASAIGVQTGRMRPEVAAALVHQKRHRRAMAYTTSVRICRMSARRTPSIEAVLTRSRFRGDKASTVDR